MQNKEILRTKLYEKANLANWYIIDLLLMDVAD